MGRTGTFITLHSQMKRLHEENSIDVFGFVKGMRRQRCLMVQTEVICPNELLLKVIYYPFSVNMSSFMMPCWKLLNVVTQMSLQGI